MEIIKTPLNDCCIIKNKKFGDSRGFFMESFNKYKLREEGIIFDPYQLNLAGSSKNVLRGLHYQLNPYSQSKIVGVMSGKVLDVAVDLRPDSETYKKSFTIELKDQETMLYVPKGFGHGYLTLTDDTVFYYLVDQNYAPSRERGIIYNDPELNIDWGSVKNPIISEKDASLPALKDAEYNF